MTRSNEDEFDGMYRSMFPKMVSFARTFCKDRDEAEDVTQDAFVKAFMAFEDCHDKQRLGNWLRRIVYRTFLDRKRVEGRRVRECINYGTDLDLTIEDQPDQSKSPEEVLLSKQMEPELERAIAGLNYEAKQLLSLVYVQERGHPEAAKKLGIDSQSCRSRAHRLCSRIRQNIAQEIDHVRSA